MIATNPSRVFVCLLAMLVGIALAGCSLLGRTELSCQARAGALVGDRWTMIVETATVTTAPGAHGSDAHNIRFYAVVVDLSAGGVPAEHARVMGPLWNDQVRGFAERWQGGAPNAVAAYFDEQGVLNWVHEAKAGAAATRLSLDLDQRLARWVPAGSVLPIPPVPDNAAEGRLSYANPRFVLAPTPSGPGVFDVRTGRPVNEPWLPAAFEAIARVHDLRGAAVSITDDGNHLVCWPSFWLNPVDGTRRMITTFNVGGGTYSRGQYAVYCSRPDPTVQVFRKLVPSTIDSDVYLGAVVVDEELLLLLRRKEQMMLVTPQNQIRFSIDAPYIGGLVRHEPGRQRINFISGGGASIMTWEYRARKVTRHQLDVRSLFRTAFGGGLVPIKAEPVRD